MREGYAKGQYVQLYYFKHGGKFYTSGQVIVPRAKSYSPSRLIALLGRARGLCS